MSTARTYKTTKGTELPILNLRGKEYLEVKYRLVWFREDHPDWGIETELLSVTDVSAYTRATIKDDKGRIICTSHKSETVQGFQDFIEKSETGAIGRALALLGYGTQFCADELDEGKRIVDTPATPPKNTHAAASKAPPPKASQRAPSNTAPPKSHTPDAFNDEDYGNFECSFSKHKGKKIRDFGEHDLDKFVKWLQKQGNLSPSAEIFIQKAEAYLAQHSFPDPRMKGDDIPF